MSAARAGTSAVAAVLAAAGLLLVLVTWAASIGPDRVVSGGHVAPARAVSPTATARPAPPPPDPQQEARRRHHGDPPAWVGTLAFVLEGLTLAVALFLVLRLVRKLRQLWSARVRRRRQVLEEVDFDVVGSARRVTEAMTGDADRQRLLLELDGEPRNAIVECWHRFELQALQAGVERRGWQTTAEFVLGVLDLVAADRGAVAELADLYREARFSDHPMTEADRRRALEALDAVHRGLRSGPRSRDTEALR